MPETAVISVIAERVGPYALAIIVMGLILRTQIASMFSAVVDYLKSVTATASKERVAATQAQDTIVAELVRSYQQDFAASRAELQRGIEAARAAEMAAREEAASLRAEVKSLRERIETQDTEIAELKARLEPPAGE